MSGCTYTAARELLEHALPDASESTADVAGFIVAVSMSVDVNQATFATADAQMPRNVTMAERS